MSSLSSSRGGRIDDDEYAILGPWSSVDPPESSRRAKKPALRRMAETVEWEGTGVAPRFESVLEEHGPALARVAASYARPGADRDDLLQEIAVALWRALPRFRGESSLRTFVFRIAHNRGLAFAWRGRSRRAAPVEAAAAAVDPAPGPDLRADGRGQEERIAAAVRALPVGPRQVLTLALEGLVHAEIAEVLGIDANNVAVRLHRARTALAKLLEERHER